MKNQFKNRNLPCSQKNSDAVCKSYVNKFFNDPSIVKNRARFDLNDKNLTNARFVQVIQLPKTDSHSTAKLYVDNAIGEESLVRNNQGNDFNNINLTNINSNTLNTQAVNDNQVKTKASVDQFHQENERSRRDLGLSLFNEEVDLVKNNQNNDLFDKKLTNINYITLNRNPSLDNELANKKYVDGSVGEGNILRFIQTLEKCLKVSVGNDTKNLTKHNKIQITYTTIIKVENSGGYLLPKRAIKCNDKKEIV